VAIVVEEVEVEGTGDGGEREGKGGQRNLLSKLEIDVVVGEVARAVSPTHLTPPTQKKEK
jgi:hypothetical protein